MRRVYDDTELEVIAQDLESTFCECIYAPNVSEYSYRMYRAKASKVKAELLHLCDNPIKFGNTTHDNGIGNNNTIEIIYTGNPVEEQICGLLHLNEDLYDGVIFWVSDIDGNKKTDTWIIK